MMTITKTFASYDEAGEYQHGLYNNYHDVKLINFPIFTESGDYTWKVSEYSTSIQKEEEGQQ